MDYKQSKTPYLSIIAAITLIAGIAHAQPDRSVIQVSIEASSTGMSQSVQITGLQQIEKYPIIIENEQNNENGSDSYTFGLD